MKALSSVLLVLAICVATVIPSGAAADKQLTNVNGDVSYQLGTAAAQSVAPHVSVALADSAFALTGPNSQAKITLPDSSVITVGQSTRIQLASFDNQPNLTSATFVLVNGKMRFAVSHPNGAKANYTFQTQTGQIAVRGTEGDISSDATQLQVNVYSLGDPNLPVEVTLNNGKKYTLGAGQALVVGITGAVIATAAISSVSSPLTSTFSEFGAPGNAGATGAAGAAGAAGAVAAPAAIAAGAAAVVAGAVIAGTSHGSPSAPHVIVTPEPGALKVSQTQFTFDGPNQKGDFTAKQSKFDGPFSITNVSDPSVISIPSTSANGDFTFRTSSTGGRTTFDVNGAPGTSPVQVSVVARNHTITLTPALQTFNVLHKTQTATAFEYGFGGVFTVSNVSGNILSFSGSSPSFTFTAVNGGTGVLGVSDGTNTLKVNVHAALGIQGLPANISLVVGGGSKNFTASEVGATTISASIDATSKATVNPGSGPAAGTLFTVTPVAFGSATLTMSDDAGNTTKIPVNVSPSPQPSSTCVPIIIHARHGGSGGGADAAATPCPTPPPSTPASPKPARPGLNPHPVALPSLNPAKPQPRHTPGNPMHPMQPITGPQGILTPPPMPVPPGGGSPP